MADPFLSGASPTGAKRNRLLISLAGAVTLALVAGLVAAMVSFEILSESESRGWVELEELASLSEQVRTVQVDFKEQIHEWKNVLLRGHDPKDFDQYFGAFEAKEKQVREGLDEVAGEMKSLGMPETNIPDLLQQHAELGVAYRDGLSLLDRSDPNNRSSSFVVDRKVRGVDRALNEQIDALATRTRGDVTERRHQLEKDLHLLIKKVQAVQQGFLVITVLLVLALLVVAMRSSRV